MYTHTYIHTYTIANGCYYWLYIFHWVSFGHQKCKQASGNRSSIVTHKHTNILYVLMYIACAICMCKYVCMYCTYSSQCLLVKNVIFMLERVFIWIFIYDPQDNKQKLTTIYFKATNTRKSKRKVFPFII